MVSGPLSVVGDVNHLARGDLLLPLGASELASLCTDVQVSPHDALLILPAADVERKRRAASLGKIMANDIREAYDGQRTTHNGPNGKIMANDIREAYNGQRTTDNGPNGKIQANDIREAYNGQRTTDNGPTAI